MELPSPAEAMAILENSEPGYLERLIEEPRKPPGPRNRTERRALARARRQKKRRESKADPPAAAPAQPKQAAQEPEKKRRAPERDRALFFLKQWAAGRGPLFDDPCVAVARAIAMDCAFVLASTGANNPAAGMRAARSVGEHFRQLPDSKAPASGEAFAAATALLADVRRAAREPGDRIAAIHGVLARAACACAGADTERQLALVGWAHLLLVVLCVEEDELRLRAARTLLRWSAPDAFKVGRGNPVNRDDEAEELIDRMRAEEDRRLAGAARSDDSPGEDPRDASPAGAAPT